MYSSIRAFLRDELQCAVLDYGAVVCLWRFRSVYDCRALDYTVASHMVVDSSRCTRAEPLHSHAFVKPIGHVAALVAQWLQDTQREVEHHPVWNLHLRQLSFHDVAWHEARGDY